MQVSNMSKFRLEALSDAVFAIVMTLLVIEIKVPELHSKFSEGELIHSLQALSPLFFAYFLSSAMIASFWFTHNYLFSLMAKTLNRNLMNLNFIFMAFLSLVPFSSHLLGVYPESKAAVLIYSLNIALLAGINWMIREYVYNDPAIENPQSHEINISHKDLVYGVVRIAVTVLGSVLAVVLSFLSTYVSLVVLVLQAVILIVPGAVKVLTKVLGLENMKIKSRAFTSK
jgi:uncharacterized membrane protein